MVAKKKRVLIVEDTADIARLISSALEDVDPNLKIIICPSAEEAMLESAREAVQLLITDIRLPGISGTELVRKLSVRNPAMKVILITGLTGAQIGQQMEGIEPEGFFQKPFELSALIDVARRCLEGPAPRPGTRSLKPKAPAARLDVPVDLLAELRQSLNAPAVLLLRLDGALVAGSGEFPGGDFEPEWAALVKETLDGQQNLSERLGSQEPQNFAVLRGQSFDLLLAALRGYALVVALRPHASALRTALALEEIARLRPALAACLNDLPAQQPPAGASPDAEAPATPVQPPAQAAAPAQPAQAGDVPPPQKPAEEELGDFAALLERPQGELQSTDVDAFWESLAQSSAFQPESKESISFDKARKLGLVSDADSS